MLVVKLRQAQFDKLSSTSSVRQTQFTSSFDKLDNNYELLFRQSLRVYHYYIIISTLLIQAHEVLKGNTKKYFDASVRVFKLRLSNKSFYYWCNPLALKY